MASVEDGVDAESLPSVVLKEVQAVRAAEAKQANNDVHLRMALKSRVAVYTFK